MSRHRGAGCVLLALLALAGCGDRSARDESLGRVVDASLGAETSRVSSATGPMDLALAAKATAVPAPMLRKFLRGAGFRAGFSRVWSSPGELTSALDYRFAAHSSATAFVSFVADRLATSAYHQPLPDPALAGSRGFSLVSRVRGATRFCVGEIFAVGVDALVVTRCAPYPLGPASITPLAQRAHAHASAVSS